MELPTEVLIYFDQLAGEPKRGLLLGISSHGYFEVNLYTPAGPRRALLPIGKTFLLSTEIDQNPGLASEIER